MSDDILIKVTPEEIKHCIDHLKKFAEICDEKIKNNNRDEIRLYLFKTKSNKNVIINWNPRN